MKVRRYRMGARAVAAAETRRRILEAAVGVFMAGDALTLEGIAARAGVTLQTVLRRFGSKARLIAAAAAEQTAAVAREREVEDGADALRALVTSYERIGELNWRLLRLEGSDPALRAVLVGARRSHRAWVARVFAPLLPARGAARARRIDALFAATDFYQWKLLRRDLGMSRARTEATLRLVVDSLAQRFAAEGARP